ncbi:histidine--tRNA ligase [Buchnera aphidicola]|uniref:histidine--tRNA ligase n=1 Tax=Buchnera aphidicola TaxID=9 RepID=UPI0030EBD7B4
MNKKNQSIRGIHDLLPKDLIIWNYIENVLKKIFNNYGYSEIRLPILEKTNLFQKSIGNSTDIIEKEMYTFLDKKGNSISLRPESTASCCRAILQNNLLKTVMQKFWYFGPMFRYERPQKERFRQFYQFGIEVFGLKSNLIDLEIILIMKRCFKQLKLIKFVYLEINTIGSLESRNIYKKKLIKFLNSKKHLFTDQEIITCKKNPLRILDSKNKNIQKILKNAPKLIDYITKKEKKNFLKFCKNIKNMSINYKINHNLVRGLDYYNDLVFEWKSNFLGSQNTICGGGRYDYLINKIYGRNIPALGFAIGMERLISLVNITKSIILKNDQTDIYFIQEKNSKNLDNIKIIENIRNNFPNLKIIFDYHVGNIKKKLIRAKKFNAKIVIINKFKKNKNFIIFKKYNENKESIILKKQIIKKIFNYFK